MAKPKAVSPPSLPVIDATLRPGLVSWFERNQRALPWRQTKDPYAIWVSEVMLQQTQVDRVIGYWTEFLERFPHVRALAKAPLADVLAAWRGLGYYTRARNLHRAAQEIVERHRGKLPDDPEALSRLPGFGRYTVGAVASIAFDRPVPLVDGNVARVFARLFELEAPPGDRERERVLWAIAEALVQGPRPGDLNQALMELGATVCTPRGPLCLLCPLQTHCRALASGRVDELPPPRKAAPRKALHLAVAVCHHRGRVVLARRAETGLFGGLWEMPSTPISLPGVADGDQALLGMLGPRAAIGPELHVVQRVLTHRDLSLHLHTAQLPDTLPSPPEGFLEWRWVPLEDIGALGMSSSMESALVEAVPSFQAPTRKGRK